MAAHQGFNLPTELWLQVFQHMDSGNELLQCRLVCNAWSAPAEDAMFSLHVTDVDLRMPFDANMETVTSILKMILNRNIKSIRGSGSTEPETYGILLRLAQEAPFKYARVETLPKPFDFGQTYFSMLQTFKKSLKHMDLVFRPGWDALMELTWSKIEEFKSLEKVTFEKHNFRNLQEVDKYFTKPSLKSLKLIINVASIDEALEQHITKVDTIKSLEFVVLNRLTGLPLLCFLLSKFPRLDSLILKEMEPNFFGLNSVRLLDAIKHIPNLDFNGQFTTPLHCHECISLTKGASNSIKIGYASDLGVVEIAPTKTSKSTDYFITIPKNCVAFSYLDVIRHFESTAISFLKVHAVELTLRGFENDWTFYRMLQAAPHAQKLTYTDLKMPYLQLSNLALPNLRDIRIFHADLDIRVLTQLSNSAPSLTKLILGTCRLCNGEEFYQNFWPVSMPNTSLYQLVITCVYPVTQNTINMNNMVDEYRHYSHIRKHGNFEDYLKPEPRHVHNICKMSMVSGPVAFLSLKTPSAKKYFVLSSGNPGAAISEDEFAVESLGCTVFDLELMSLKSFQVFLGSFSATLNFDQDYNLK
ncbi:hypothetical protein MBANPS3_010028 [Mucor bainieri]